MRSILAALALCALPSLAYSQSATCPAYSMHARTHPAAETAYTINPAIDQCRMLVFLNSGAETVTFKSPLPFPFAVWLFASGAGGLTLSGVSGVTSRAQNTGALCMATAAGGTWWCKP
jgi:hypothetical protein